MGQIVIETKYDRGDLVVFSNKDDHLEVGIVEGFNLDGTDIWYNIRMNKKEIYTYSTGEDIPEWDILGKLDGELEKLARDTILED